ncbi:MULTISPECIES: radical SAM/SPASM domain-containing protein [unclassified Clostridioides]|uniref:radical SAM/SPASM domain-containing protein n=1 Tax=unclassified Clostridioides TaxID=2635829 RepID=UPI001D110C31|nr:radical SAM protein [Clostridioides sp. ZZV14-6150]MCC0723355.1 radical SAM protein [Clostridioides sp. ZZV14-6104]MCC0742772.1 radical SAM protein [Clostridioides sp. ZZV14-6044]MCC0751273.1 radical SAM protein [Clostridioides sp. ZZV13-5731]
MNFTILVTEDCNLNCNYCYEGSNKQKNYMNLDTADRVIEFILNQIKKVPKDKRPLYIVFHGGEPLLNFDIIKYLNKSLNELVKDRKIIYDMTSNGTILNDEIEDFIKDNIGTFSISIDGTKESHDKNRVFSNGSGSYDLVIKNTKKLLEEGIELRARMTFNEYNVNNLFESVVSVNNLGFKYIVPAIDFYANWDDDSLEILSNEIDKLIEFKKENRQAEVSLININMLNKKKGDCFGGICSFNIDAEGLIYPCTFVVSKEDYVIGDIKRGKNCLDENKIDEFKKINFSENKNCLKCTRYNYCTGVRCKILNKLVTGNYNLPPYITCFEEHLNVRTTKKLLDYCYS